MASLDHERFMRRAIALTANCPRLPFGALVVCGDTGEVLAEGWACTIIGGVLERECNALFEAPAG